MHIDSSEMHEKSAFYNHNEAENWQKFRQGDERAFICLHDTYYNELYFYALKIVRDEHLVKNAIQELFLYLWKNKEQLAEVGAVKNYLFLSLRRHIFRLLQKEDQQQKFARITVENSERFTFSPEDIILEKESKSLQKNRITKALNCLPERQREAIYLRYINGLSNAEIAGVMDLNYQSVQNCLGRALANLKKELLTTQNAEVALFALAFPFLLFLLL